MTSAVVSGDPESSLAAFHTWWAERQSANRFDVERIPFEKMDDWHFDPATGNLGHASSRFFTIEGLDISTGGGATWSQPIIHQPEIGILGILAKRFDGVLHFLMQAKMEPGNVNTLQLSPTVQATRSNYTRVHRGGATRYLEFFRERGRGTVLADVLQSEQGAWFWHKHNRNMVVEAIEDVPVHEDFRWVTLRQLRELMRIDNLVNMDARTVLSCLPLTGSEDPDLNTSSPFESALRRSYGARDGDTGPGRHTEAEILSWFTEMKTRNELRARLTPLAGVKGWRRTGDAIEREDGGRFRIVAVRVRAGNREVTSWTQPLLAPCEQGLAAFVARPIDGVVHLLVQARPEPGLRDTLEMAPTVQLPVTGEPGPVPFLTDVTDADPGRTRFDTVLSEEGGRFHHARTRYRLIEAGADFPLEVPENYRWMTVRQLMDLLRHGHYLNVEARSLIACVHSLW
ncbi:NDP-hexose 2,3-dehydratase family protein [Streptomyces sp. UG1]|uniref:NDP-hexose 2,3-dehydratase family protein n=1 Tax=Streptomyces sp. UG1 TaxID=3417652 RepID=UPI003CF34AA5